MIVSYDTLPTLRDIHANERIVFGGGVFDLIHEGHVAALEYWKSLGDRLVVGVVSNERVRQRKGAHRPLRDEIGRLSVINAFRAVDYCFLLPLPTEATSPTVQAIAHLKPNVFVQYHDALVPELNGPDPLELMDVDVIIDRRPKLDSTTAIIARALQEQSLKQEAPRFPDTV